MVEILAIDGPASAGKSSLAKKLSNFYKRELDETINVLTKLMEPAVIFIVSAIVGTIVIALYLPMFSLLDKI